MSTPKMIIMLLALVAMSQLFGFENVAIMILGIIVSRLNEIIRFMETRKKEEKSQ